MAEGFLGDWHMAMLFYRTCGLYGIDGREERMALLRKIVARKKARYIRDVDAFVQGKDIIKITKRGPKE